jgi:hypothetical protein
MELFENYPDEKINLLPNGGIANYFILILIKNYL